MRVKTGTIAITVAVCLTSVVFGQGSLTPSGAPAPTMKTLDELNTAIAGVSNAVDAIRDEARIPISASTTINSAGSYYLATNIVTEGTTPGIRISSDNVMVDLNGFSILGSGANGNGISISIGVDNAVVRNGTIRDCYKHGVSAGNCTNCTFRNLRILGNARNGAPYAGIQPGYHARVENCRVIGNLGLGVFVNSNSVVVGNTIENQGAAGLRVIGSGTYIADNIVKGNADNYDLSSGNQINILLCEIPETLDWPCSVKLAGTLTCSQNNVDGITVNADDISINLDGHTLSGPGASSGHGIFQATTHRNLSVENGKVVEWRGVNRGGIYASGKVARIQGVQASTNYYGIYTGYGSMINGCTACDNGYDGILAGTSSEVSGCTACDNGCDGISAGTGAVSGCAAHDNGDDGISASGGTISGCTAYDNGDDGIYGTACTISGCTADQNTGDGIEVHLDCLVVGNTCYDNGYIDGDGAGIHARSSGNRLDGNNVTDNDRGIDVDYSVNFIIRNTASGNTVNWDVGAGNVCLVVNATSGGTITGDSGGTSPGSTDPNANFTY